MSNYNFPSLCKKLKNYAPPKPSCSQHLQLFVPIFAAPTWFLPVFKLLFPRITANGISIKPFLRVRRIKKTFFGSIRSSYCTDPD
jgi:hypothetical protein